MTKGVITTGDECQIVWQQDGEGDKPWLILSNSLGTNMSMWAPQVDAFAEHFRVIRYDTRGHGQSGVAPGGYGLDRLGRDVIELADGLGIETFSLCGVSLGGMTAQWLGIHAPDRLEKIVIANSSPFMGPPSGWDARIKAVMANGVASIGEAVVERWFTPEFRENPDNYADILSVLKVTSAAGYSGCCAAIRDMDMRRMLPLIETPALVIGGSEDMATPPEHTELLSNGISGSETVMLKAAHLSNLELPDQFNAAVLDFFGVA